MKKSIGSGPVGSTRKTRPALYPEAREKQLVSLAVDLVEKRLREGTATSQEVTAILRLGSLRTQLENEKLRHEVELTKAKTESINSAKHMEEVYDKALKAMRSYSGLVDEDDNGED